MYIPEPPDYYSTRKWNWWKFWLYFVLFAGPFVLWGIGVIVIYILDIPASAPISPSSPLSLLAWAPLAALVTWPIGAGIGFISKIFSIGKYLKESSSRDSTGS